MTLDLRVLAAAGSLLLAFSIGETAFAQKQGGTLRIHFFDSPASSMRKRLPPVKDR
jgi:hypothetical protein